MPTATGAAVLLNFVVAALAWVVANRTAATVIREEPGARPSESAAAAAAAAAPRA